ncbi:MAG: CPBP family intramembrane glutamic endopeptidase [Bacteroidota bacterium]
MSDTPTSSPLPGSEPAVPARSGVRSEADLLGKRGMLADRPDPRGFTKPTAVVRDPWSWAKPVRLTGWLERQDFHPVLLAILVPVVAFFIYQLIGALAVAAMVIPGAVSDAQSGAAPDLAEVMTQLTERADLLLIGNAIGQYLGFGLLVFLFVMLHTRQRAQFAYVRRADTPGLLLAVVGLFVLLPFNTWLAELNNALPLPQAIRDFDQSQMEMIEGLLGNLDISIGLALVLVALTPALCEEYLFRGYMQRQLERRIPSLFQRIARSPFASRRSRFIAEKAPIIAVFVIVGVVFGLYHMRLTQALPLSFLGAYLAFAVWATGSLWTGVVLHLINNGLAVLLMDYAKRNPDSQVAALEDATMPWYGALVSFGLFVAVVVAMQRRRRALVGDAGIVEEPEMDVDADLARLEAPSGAA